MLRCLILRLCISAALVLAALSAGCGGGSDQPAAATTPFESVTQSQTLGTAGGSVSLTAADGTQYTLLVPAGALAGSTTLSLTTAQPAGEQRFRVIAGPEGLVFKAGSAATLTIQLPAGRALPTEGALTYNGAPVPVTRNADGSLALRLVQLRGSAAATGLVRPAAAAAGSLLVCRNPGLPADADTGVSSIDRRDLTRYADCVLGQIEDLDAAGDFDTAIRLAMSMDELFQHAGMDGTPFLTAARSSTCAARQRAIDVLQPIVVTELADILKIEKLAYWDMVMQKLGGAACSGQPGLASLVQPKVEDALELLADELPAFRSVTAGSAEYLALSNQARATIALRDKLLAMAAALGTPVPREAPAALRERPAATLAAAYSAAAIATGSLQGQLEPAALASLLHAPWNACRADGSRQGLVTLAETFGATTPIQEAAQYCGTQLATEVLDSAGQIKSVLTGLGGVAAGQTQDSASIHVAATDKLSLNGPITALTCPQGLSGSETVVLRAGTAEVQRFSAAPYLAGLLTLRVADLRAAAGRADGDTMPLDLTLEREGAPCGGYWGAGPRRLLTLQLSFRGPPKLAFWSARAAAGEYIYDPANGQQTLLQALDARDILVFDAPSWSPDGRRLAIPSWDRLNNKFFIRILEADGSGESNLTPPSTFAGAMDPAWSPDGTRIALSRFSDSSNGNVVTLNPDGSGEIFLTQDGQGGGRSPSWSPDGQRIVFVRNRQLYLMNADGSGQAPLDAAAAPPTGPAAAPRWSPDGRRIAFIKATDEGEILTIVNIDGTGQTGILAHNGINGFSWSPDGSQIAIGLSDFPNSVFSIYTLKPDGTSLTDLTRGTRDFYPAWSR